MAFRQGDASLDRWGQPKVQEVGLGGTAFRIQRHRTVIARKLSGNDAQNSTTGQFPLWNRLGRDVLIARGGHLEPGWEVQPELKAAHQALFLLRHLGMNEATAGRHPLYGAGAKEPLVALAVTVTHAAREHDGDCLETAVRVVRKAADVSFRIIGTKFIKQEKGIQRLKLRRADDPGELDPRAVARGDPSQLPDQGPWMRDGRCL